MTTNLDEQTAIFYVKLNQIQSQLLFLQIALYIIGVFAFVLGVTAMFWVMRWKQKKAIIWLTNELKSLKRKLGDSGNQKSQRKNAYHNMNSEDALPSSKRMLAFKSTRDKFDTTKKNKWTNRSEVDSSSQAINASDIEPVIEKEIQIEEVPPMSKNSAFKLSFKQ